MLKEWIQQLQKPQSRFTALHTAAAGDAHVHNNDLHEELEGEKELKR